MRRAQQIAVCQHSSVGPCAVPSPASNAAITTRVAHGDVHGHLVTAVEVLEGSNNPTHSGPVTLVWH